MNDEKNSEPPTPMKWPTTSISECASDEDVLHSIFIDTQQRFISTLWDSGPARLYPTDDHWDIVNRILTHLVEVLTEEEIDETPSDNTVTGFPDPPEY